MGYNLGIGNGVVRVSMDERRAWVGVDCEEFDEAPVNSCDDRSNFVYPSYTQWAEFSRRHGLDPVFYSGARGRDVSWFVGESGREYEGLLSQHPGAAELTEDHYKAFAAARDRFDPSSAEDPYDQKRLDWLVWWTRWALDNCPNPTFYNS